jgi:hypothetical protein
MKTTTTQQEINGDRVVLGVIATLAVLLCIWLIKGPVSAAYLVSALVMGVVMSALVLTVFKRVPFLPQLAIPVDIVLSHICFSKEVFEKYTFWIVTQWAWAYLLTFLLVWFWVTKKAENKAKHPVA